MTLTGKMFPERGKWTPSRYSLAMIQLADVVRKSVNLRLSYIRQGQHPITANELDWKLDELFKTMAKSLPLSMRVEALDQDTSTEVNFNLGAAATLRSNMEKWLFHQQVFHIYLEIQSGKDDKVQPISQSMIDMAHIVLDMRKQIKEKCVIADNLR